MSSKAKVVKVHVDIVGMFFTNTVDLELNGEGTATVEQVLNSARVNDKGSILSYTKEGLNLDSFRVVHPTPPISRSHKQYPAGIYDFSDPAFKKGVSGGVPVWQYYVVDAHGNSVSDDGKFQPFSMAHYAFQDGWKVIWRCVLIFTGPVAPVSLKQTVTPKS